MNRRNAISKATIGEWADYWPHKKLLAEQTPFGALSLFRPFPAETGKWISYNFQYGVSRQPRYINQAVYIPDLLAFQNSHPRIAGYNPFASPEEALLYEGK